MSTLVDWQIAELCNGEDPMIFPFLDHQVREVDGRKTISYGLSSAGYDICLASHIKICDEKRKGIIDPKDSKEKDFYHPPIDVDGRGSFVMIPPTTYALGHSEEYFRIPNNILGTAYGKSTLARVGLHILVTPLEPGWRGNLVVEIANLTPMYMKLYLYEGICQIRFDTIELPQVSYADRAGKYQGQTGVQLAKV